MAKNTGKNLSRIINKHSRQRNSEIFNKKHLRGAKPRFCEQKILWSKKKNCFFKMENTQIIFSKLHPKRIITTEGGPSSRVWPSASHARSVRRGIRLRFASSDAAAPSMGAERRSSTPLCLPWFYFLPLGKKIPLDGK